MTGICGIWYRDGRAGAHEAVRRMQSTLAIYGPDRAGTWDGHEIALASQLAYLLPEDRFDRQPLVSEDRRLAVVADVRLDNRGELATELGIGAERLATISDAALLLAAWQAWGTGSIPRLYGDFAFAVWDETQRALFLVRDFPGARPLFYHRGDGWLAFASMAKGLHALPQVPYAADPDTIRNLLGFLPMAGPASFFAGVDRVEPGDVVTFRSDGSHDVSAWYRPPATKLPEIADPREYVVAVRECLDRAVADRLRRTGGVASTLSGGFDTAAVTTSAALQLSRANERLTAYTHVPMEGVALESWDQRFADEGPLARLVASRYANIDHVLVDAPDRQIGDDLDERFHYQEMPALNLCNEVWISEIARLAGSARGTVLLTAVWGNMTISDKGLERLNALLYRGRLLRWLREAGGLLRRREIRPAALAYWSMRPLLTPSGSGRLLRLAGKQTRDPQDYSLLRPDVIPPAEQSDRPDRFVGTGGLTRERAGRAALLLWQQELMTGIQKGMLARFGVDFRDPTGDRRLIDLCLSLPDSLFLRNGRSKWLYHQAFGDRVPDEVLNERRKGLQGADWCTRLHRNRDRIREEARRARNSESAGTLFDVDALVQLTETIPEGGPVTSRTVVDYRYKLLRSLSAAHFLRKTEGGNV